MAVKNKVVKVWKCTKEQCVDYKSSEMRKWGLEERKGADKCKVTDIKEVK